MSTPMRFGLQRPRDGLIAGVCAALAERFGVARWFVRLVFIVFAVTGIGELAYIILWVLVPKQPDLATSTTVPVRRLRGGRRR